jgi:glutamyl-tRNA synthetase
MPDFILLTKRNNPSYQIASLMDDVDLSINIIVRGKDLLPSTAAQLYLSKLLKLPFHEKTLFHHHALLHDKQGQKLSKTAGNSEWKGLRNSGMGSGEVIQEIFLAMNMEQPGVHKLSEIKEPADYLPALRIQSFGS